ncbi:hypothetical protein [Lentzea xinjiangensis]|nr:hypothetical protein [Lentzea xinjiangensis]
MHVAVGSRSFIISRAASLGIWAKLHYCLNVEPENPGEENDPLLGTEQRI